jgi:7-carboxy-7-deazaguanine synthase
VSGTRMRRQTTSMKTPPRTVVATGATGHVSEMFCSIQGEGIYLGERQLFVRMAGCTATCYWCDTVSSKKERSACIVHGSEKRSLANPLTAEDAVREGLALAAASAPVRTVSLTGGEPLEQCEFVSAIAAGFGDAGLRVYLETNGLEVDALTKVLPRVDVVAMDIKLPHATGREHWTTHRDFLARAVARPVFVKIVVDSTTPWLELEAALDLIAEVDLRIPTVLQPESTTYLKEAKGPEARRELMRLLEAGQRHGLKRLHDVRVIPQCHKVLRVR